MADKNPTPIGGEGKIVEADTTYIGGREKNKQLASAKPPTSAAWQADCPHSGRARWAFPHVANVTGKTLRPLLVKNVSRKSTLMTDTHGGYHCVTTTVPARNSEKKTDVAIAVSIIADGLEEAYDKAFLISADSDHVPLA